MSCAKGRVGALLAGAALMTGACGAGKEGPAQTPAAGSRGVVPVPRLSVSQTVSWLQRVAAHPSCAPTRRLLHPVFGKKPSEGICQQFHTRLAGMVEPHAKRYGTGMVIEYTTLAGSHRAAVMALDGTLAFRLVLIVDISARTIGTPRPKAFDKAARRATDAIAKQDCDAFLRVATRSVGVGAGSREAACARLPKLGVTQELLSHPGVRPEALGGNRAFAFYGMRFAPGAYDTMVMLREASRKAHGSTGHRYAFVTALPVK